MIEIQKFKKLQLWLRTRRSHVRQMRQHLDQGAQLRSPQGDNSPKAVIGQSCQARQLKKPHPSGGAFLFVVSRSKERRDAGPARSKNALAFGPRSEATQLRRGHNSPEAVMGQSCHFSGEPQGCFKSIVPETFPMKTLVSNRVVIHLARGQVHWRVV